MCISKERHRNGERQPLGETKNQTKTKQTKKTQKTEQAEQKKNPKRPPSKAVVAR